MALSDNYTTKYREIPKYFNSILGAQPPQRFSIKFLESLGFSNTNDGRIIGVLKDLGFLNTDGAPQKRYLDFLDPTQSRRVLADGIREAYSDLFAVNKKANELTAEEAKSKLRLLYPGKKTNLVIGHIAETFVALCQYADFSETNSKPESIVPLKQITEPKIFDQQNYLDAQTIIAGSGGGLPAEKLAGKPKPSPEHLTSRLDQMIAAADAAHTQARALGKGVDRPGTVVIYPEPGDRDPGAGADDPAVRIPGPDDMMPAPPLMHPRYVLEPVAIALGGGGSVGDFELGALDFIHTQFLGTIEGAALGFERPRFDIATGTSVGAVNAGALAQGAAGSMEELKQIWFHLETSDNFYVLNSEFRRFIGNPEDNLVTSADRMIHNIVSYGEVYTRMAAQTAVMNPEPLARLCWGIEQYWSPSGPGLRGAGVSVARDLHGHRILFARGYDDMLYVRWQLDVDPISATTRWSSWRSMGGPISSDPAAYSTGFLDPYGFDFPGNVVRVGVLARFADEQRYGGCTLDDFDDATHAGPIGYDPFGAWADVPSPPAPDRPFCSQPTILQRAPDGRAWAFCRDQNPSDHPPSGMAHRSFFSTWNGHSWESWTMFGQDDVDIGGNITGCSYPDGTLELFTRSANSVLLHNFSAAGSAPGEWRGGMGGANSDLLVVPAETVGYIQVDLFWRGDDGAVWTRRKVGSSGTWTAARSLGGMITSNLCAGRNSDGICTIFARGLDDQLYALRQTTAFGDWPADAWGGVGAPPNLRLLADPYALTGFRSSRLRTDEIEIYAVASDHSVWAIRQRPDGSYTDWIPLGGKIWTGMYLRMCVVALEDGEVRYVEEAGRFVDQAGRFIPTPAGGVEPIVSNDGNIFFARSRGAIASCSAPALFPAIPLNGKSWVDGGIRYGVPIGAAIAAGATRVIAIATVPLHISPVAPLLPRSLAEPWPSLEDFILSSVGQPPEHLKITDYSSAAMIDVLTRSFVELLVDATSWSELYPPTRWPVPVWKIQQTFKTHEGGTIDPGLIRINYSYGWMRAFDILLASEAGREAAVASTDRIIQARWSAWKAEMRFREAYLIASLHDASSKASMGTGNAGNDWEFDQAWAACVLAERWLRECRGFKTELADALVERRDTLRLPLDPESPLWLSRFERFAAPGHWTHEWKAHRNWESVLPFDTLTIPGLGNNPRSVTGGTVPAI